MGIEQLQQILQEAVELYLTNTIVDPIRKITAVSNICYSARHKLEEVPMITSSEEAIPFWNFQFLAFNILDEMRDLKLGYTEIQEEKDTRNIWWNDTKMLFLVKQTNQLIIKTQKLKAIITNTPTTLTPISYVTIKESRIIEEQKIDSFASFKPEYVERQIQLNKNIIALTPAPIYSSSPSTKIELLGTKFDNIVTILGTDKDDFVSCPYSVKTIELLTKFTGKERN